MRTKVFHPTSIEQLVIAGWTGRNAADVQSHIRELEAMGMTPPSTTPVFYRASASLLTTANAIQVLCDDTSGEVEFVVVNHPDGLWIGLGSDHTDRAAERTSVPTSKQLCSKVVARELWGFDDVVRHWDRLEMRSWIHRSGARRLYQETSVAALLSPGELISRYEATDGSFGSRSAMYGGTVSAIGGIAPSDVFEMELFDPVLDRRLSHRYRIETLPVIS